MNNSSDEPAHGRGGPSYFCLGKSNQNRSQREGFFAAQASCAANRAKPGLQSFCTTTFAQGPPLQQKVAMPYSRTRPTLFCAISPEAAPLGKKLCLIYLWVNLNSQRTLRPPKHIAAQGPVPEPRDDGKARPQNSENNAKPFPSAGQLRQKTRKNRQGGVRGRA